MHGELQLSTATLLGFLATLARIGGVFVFLPLPGMKSGTELARIVLSVSVTMALFPHWPQVSAEGSAGILAVWMISEAALGIGIGLAVAFVIEALLVAAQTLGLQAGYAFASMVDPNTQADSGILVIFAQLAAGLLFFGAGFDREVLRIFARSLDILPAGSFVLSRGMGQRLLATGAAMFSTGVRLALPVIAVLAMVDISLALLGRVNAQLQLLTIAFPVKMMLALTVFGWILVLVPAVMRNDMDMALTTAKGLLVR
jgi:flagellar biosynthetic protein FliR